MLTIITSNIISNEKPKKTPDRNRNNYMNFSKKRLLNYIFFLDSIRSYVDKKKYLNYKHSSNMQVLIIRGIQNL